MPITLHCSDSKRSRSVNYFHSYFRFDGYIQDSYLVDKLDKLSLESEHAERVDATDKVSLFLSFIDFSLTNLPAQLADLITAISLTDKGSCRTEQPSKLWSSRRDLQATSRPLEIHNVTITEVERSIGAVLHAQLSSPDLPLATHPSASVPVAHPSIPVVNMPIPNSAMTFPPPPDKPLHRANLPRPAAFAPPHKPVGAWVKKALDIITQIEEKTHEVNATLTLPDHFDGRNAAQVAQMRVFLAAAAEHVDSAGQSLKFIQRNEREVIDRKEKVISLLKEIDVRISFLGATFPPPPETTPVFFDAGTPFNVKLYSIFSYFFSVYL